MRELLREVQKLKVRLEEYLKEENAFIEALREAIKVLTELSEKAESLSAANKPTGEIANLRIKAIKSLSEALKKEGKAEHEKSHLLESYSALILALEEASRD
ncbi:MAG: hypothetical protein ACTSWP_01130 [Candidatus Freyarchaeota archaeon]|nr:hypothetical protein [Candidatus Freyrarchaeum guaymaensis]